MQNRLTIQPCAVGYLHIFISIRKQLLCISSCSAGDSPGACRRGGRGEQVGVSTCFSLVTTLCHSVLTQWGVTEKEATLVISSQRLL